MFCFQVLPLHVVNATNYFGHIVDKQKDQYMILAEEINEYFKETSNRVGAQKVEKLALCGFCEETVFQRYWCLFFHVYFFNVLKMFNV